MDLALSCIFENTFYQLLMSGTAALLLTVVFIFLKKTVIRSLEKSKLFERYSLLEVFTQTKNVFLAVTAIYFSLQFLTLSNEVELIAWRAFVVVFGLQLGFWANEGLAFLLQRSKMFKKETGEAIQSITVFHLLSKSIVWAFVAIFLLDNLGFDITALVAGLGVGGIAIALAAQNILGDLFASLSIVIDKPFTIGDFIVLDQYRGTVEQIGLKTTRLRSFSGEQIVIGNGDLLKCRIKNFRQMERRRLDFTLGIEMSTPLVKLKTLLVVIQKVIEEVEGVAFSRAHFKSIGSFAYEFEAAYYVLSSNRTIAMDKQQQINFRILESLDEEGIQLAYPTSTVRINKGN